MSFFGDTRKKITLQEIKNATLPLILDTGVYTISSKLVPTLASEEKSMFRIPAGAMVTIEMTEGAQLGVDVYSPNLHPQFSLIDMEDQSSLTIKGGTWGPVPHGSVITLLGQKNLLQGEQATFLNFGSHAIHMPVSSPQSEILMKYCKFISKGTGCIGKEAIRLVNQLGKLSKLELECSQKKFTEDITSALVEKNDMYDVQAIHAVGAQKITVFQCLFDLESYPTISFQQATSAVSCKQCSVVDIKGCTIHIRLFASLEFDNRSEGFDVVALSMEDCSRVSVENIMAPAIVAETGHASVIKLGRCAMAKLKTNTVEKIQAGSDHEWVKIPQVIVFYSSECILNLEDSSNKVLEMVSMANPLFIGIESFPTSKATLVMQQPRKGF